MLVFFIIAAAVMTASMITVIKKELGKRSFPLVTVLVTALLIIVTAAVPTTALAIAVGENAKCVRYIDDIDTMNQNLYYDNVEDRYFIVEADPWDMSKLQYRVYLETEWVENYLEHRNAIENTPMFARTD